MRSIRIENVTKLLNSEVILESLSLTIPAGKFFALLGPSGCGKTTILRLIAGFESVDGGKIFWVMKTSQINRLINAGFTQFFKTMHYFRI
jgi:ABC-type spermidine/putrescine transport systems, ATPase components